MGLIEQLVKAFEAEDGYRGDVHGRMARAAIADVFAWLEEPSDAAVEAGRWPAEDDGPVACLKAMLAVMRREVLGE